MDLAWLTDIHLNFLRHTEACKAFGRYVAADLQGLEGPRVIVTGDIAECLSLVPMFYEFIEGLNEKRKIPTYFVLGNHDAYGGSIAASHVGAEAIEKIARKNGNTALWLTNAGVIELSKTVALMGHDGWYDGRYGSPESSR